MKKTLFCLLALLTISAWSTAQTISIEDVETRTGNTSVSVALRVEGAESMTSMHIELSDPSGLFAIKSASATPAWTALFSTGSAGMSAISTSDNAFSGDGIVATIELSMPEDIAIGIYPIDITNVRINGADVDGTSFNVTVTDYVTLDENSTTVPEAAEAVNVRVLRTINAGVWSTICLPFEMTEAQTKEAFGEDVQLADFDGIESTYDGENVTGIKVKFNTVAAIEANHPYIIKVSTAITEFIVDAVDIAPSEELSVDRDEQKTKIGSKWFTFYNSFIGTFVADTEVPENNLFISDNKFWYSTGKTRMKAFRAYFDFYDVLTEVEEASVKVIACIDDEETGLDEIVNHESSNGKWFDLSGRRVAKPNQRGIYIVDGQKRLIK